MLDSIFGNYMDRERKDNKKDLRKIAELEKRLNITNSQRIIKVRIDDNVVNMTEEAYAFYKKTNEFRRRLREGQSIESIMPEALAVCREAVKRKLNMRPYDVQVEAAMAMQGKNIIEMKTGEGKSLVQILSAYLKALDATKSENKKEWGSIHILTSNDYLAQRDQETNKEVFSLLGFTSSYVLSKDKLRGKKENLKSYKDRKKEAYKCDIVYSTARTVAFDYLQDNTRFEKEDVYITRPLHSAIVDEADDILLDDATKPLILNGNPSKGNEIFDRKQKELENKPITVQEENIYLWATKYINGVYRKNNEAIPTTYYEQKPLGNSATYRGSAVFANRQEVLLSPMIEDELYNMTEKEVKSKGTNEDINALYAMRLSAVELCILAREVYHADKQYLIRDNKIVLVDSNGRPQHKSKYRDGLHEALEYKEDFRLKKEGKKGIELSKPRNFVAKCTFPDFFSIYSNGYSGMTGTSDKEEFEEIYDHSTYKVESRIPNIRKDEEDEIYTTMEAKHQAIIKEVLKCQKTGQPVLIGTLNIIESKAICDKLEALGIRFQRLDALSADSMEKESAIVSTAGLLGSVTVATNMAGRGTDIKLGPGVKEVGGLYVIGASKNNNVRIDNQLRGRAGRQGDPGKSKYFISLDDEMIQKRGRKQIFRFQRNAKDGRITNKRIIKLVEYCQKIETGIQKLERKIKEKRAMETFTPYKNEIYAERKKVFDANPDEFEKYILRKVDGFVDTTFLISKDYDDLSARFKNIAYIDPGIYQSSLHNGTIDGYKKELANSIKEKIKAKMTTKEDKMNFYVENRYNALESFNGYWADYSLWLEDFEAKQSLLRFGANYNQDTFKNEANKRYVETLSSLFNDIISFAINGEKILDNQMTNEESIGVVR